MIHRNLWVKRCFKFLIFSSLKSSILPYRNSKLSLQRPGLKGGDKEKGKIIYVLYFPFDILNNVCIGKENLL